MNEIKQRLISSIMQGEYLNKPDALLSATRDALEERITADCIPMVDTRQIAIEITNTLSHANATTIAKQFSFVCTAFMVWKKREKLIPHVLIHIQSK